MVHLNDLTKGVLEEKIQMAVNELYDARNNPKEYNDFIIIVRICVGMGGYDVDV